MHITVEWQNKATKGYPDIVQLELYRDGRLYKSFASDSLPYIPRQIVVENLPLGSYSLRYRNFLDQPMMKTIEVPSPGVFYVSVYPDSSNRKNAQRTCINLLEDLDSLRVFYDKAACFDFDSDSFIVVREANKYRLRHGSKEIALSAKQRELLVKLESDLMSMPEGGSCSTSETYHFSLKGKSRTYTDASCRFHGWDTFMRSLNLRIDQSHNLK